MKNSNDERDKREEYTLFCFYKVHPLRGGILLFESEFILSLSVYCKF